MSRSATLLEPTQHWWHRMKISTEKFAIVLVIAAFVSGISYVLLTNQTSTVGFEIKNLQQQVAKINDDNEKLELRAADLRALSAVGTTSATLSLKPADQVEYLLSDTGKVAFR